MLRPAAFIFILSLAACVPLRDVPRKAEKGPPGTLFLRDSLYMDVTEITNLDWLEYVHSLSQKYGTEYPEIVQKALPDSLIWRDRSHYSETYVGAYFRHPAYRDYPVVGVTYRQVMDYCLWRTERVREQLKTDTEFSATITYRLPTREEWMHAAAAGLDTVKFPLGYEEPRDRYGVYKYELRQPAEASRPVKEHLPVPVRTGRPNRFGFYGLIGNVAEMTSEEGTACGGSFRHYPDQSRVSQTQEYSGAQTWLGFRCVCVVKKK